MDKLFGTDGVRGLANVELTAELAFQLGRAAVAVLCDGDRTAGGRRKTVVVGQDTRRSGDMLKAALAAGIASAGYDVDDVGVVPTPAVAYLTRAMDAAFGVMISASHNPPEDNGIKFFGGDGFKLDDHEERAIERFVREGADKGRTRPGADIGRIVPVEGGAERYVAMLEQAAPTRLDGLRIAIDCANGAAFSVGPLVLERLGAEVIPLFHEPDGMNINVGCGSLHPEALQAAVVQRGADAGISLDGDADRVMMVDGEGNVLDGDVLLAICGLHLKETGKLPRDRVVATVYSNFGLHKTFARHGIEVVETPPGDRSVMLAMREQGLNLGGEQSGHIIFLEHNTTGDGLLAALQLLGVMRERQQPLSALAGCMQRVPLVLEAVPVQNKASFYEHDKIRAAIDEAAERLQPDGRLFVRPSGTEPVIRVLGEGEDEARVKETVEGIVELIKTELSS